MVTKKDIEAVVAIVTAVNELRKKPKIKEAVKILKKTASKTIKNVKKKFAKKKKSVKKPAKKVKAKRSKKK